MQEDRKTFSNNRKELLSTGIVLALVVAGFAAIVTGHINRLLYAERAANANSLMAQISYNIENTMTNNWENLERDAKLMAMMAPGSIEEALDIVAGMEKSTTGNDEGLFIIDDRGVCHTSNGKTFRWSDTADLAGGAGRLLSVSSIPSLGITDDKIIFMVKPDEPIGMGDMQIEYFAGYTGHIITEGVLNESTFGGRAILFTIEENGTFVYTSGNDGILSDIYNFRSRLEHWRFRYGSSSAELEEDIVNQVPGCALADTGQGYYFILHHPMDVNGWTTVLMIPEELVGTSSKSFMNTVALCVFMMLVFAFAAILYIVIIFNRRAREDHRKINEKLNAAMEAEKTANNAKTRFLSTFSHDIRTPMNSITGMVTIAKKHINDKAYVEGCIDKIMISSNHLLGLINDILDISKIESGNIVVTPGAFNISEMMNNIVNMLAPRIREKRQTFDVEIHDISKEYLYTDQLRVNQIYVNLLSNALKYTPVMGNIRMEFYEETIPDDPGQVMTVFIVQDNGIGMTEEFMKTMFEPFTRAVDPGTSAVEGTGLGLLICKELSELLGGTIECESEHHKGTKFTVAIPMALASQEDIDELMKTAVTDSEDIGEDLKGLHILVAEDNEINWEIAMEELGLFGITTVRAEDGKECVEILRESSDGEFDMVLMDVQMPRLNGHEATKIIRASARDYLRNIPIIAMTADAFAEDIQASFDAGMDGHISKPIDINLMLRELRKARNKE